MNTSKGKYYIETFGCQMNVHDSEKLAISLDMHGWTAESDIREADLVIVNTCSVRDKAEQKVFSRFGRLRELKEEFPDKHFILAGCMARAWGRKLLKRIPFLDMICGPGAIGHIPDYLEQMQDSRRPIVDIDDPDSIFSVDPLGSGKKPEGHHAWITIMEGCNNFCSYCIVPYVRGRERSRPAPGIIEEVKKLAQAGIREITLLGQNVNSYSGLDGGFPELLRALDPIQGIHRIRFTTSHPKDMSQDLIQAVADLPKLCEYLHFPIQSGSTRILKLMRRGYTRESYLNVVNALKSLIPDVALSSDFIVGFPGETDEDFEQTLSLLKTVEYDNSFIFAYSVRSGTKAAGYKDDVPRPVKIKRLQKLLNTQREIALHKSNKLIGQSVEVLVDGSAKRGGSKMKGRSRQNRVVNFEGSAKVGDLVFVRIESASPNCLYGVLDSSG